MSYFFYFPLTFQKDSISFSMCFCTELGPDLSVDMRPDETKGTSVPT